MPIPPLLHVFGRSTESTATFAEARPSNHLLTFLSKLKNISTSHTFNLALSRVLHASEPSAPQHLSNFTDISTSHRFKSSVLLHLHIGGERALTCTFFQAAS
ncbi:uncharacterized protein LOC135374438 [Ornithodoros turicata]|uniref:uncharacterized protein LOC135374438 n=1 Tax=Ornithodoros turicata TaxID=34597 RepID=UPI00313993A8